MNVTNLIDELRAEIAALPGDQKYRDGAEYALSNLRGRIKLASTAVNIDVELSDVDKAPAGTKCRWCPSCATTGYELACGFPIGRIWIHVCDVHVDDVNRWLGATDTR